MLGAPMRKLITKLAIGIVMVGLSNNFKLTALESDKDQQVIWSADGNSAMRITEDRRILEMSNNVIVNQGTLEIRGDRAIFEYEASTNVLKQVQVFGQPVRYQQQLDGDESSVSGVSDSLILSINDFDETILELIGNAQIESPSSTIKCNSIIYLVNRDLIREAAGPCEGALGAQQN